MIMQMIIVVRARTYNSNACLAKLYLLSPAFQKFIEYWLETKPSILWLQIVLSDARRDDSYDGDYCYARQEL